MVFKSGSLNLVKTDVAKIFFQRGTTHIVWSSGEGPLYRLGGLIASGDHTGMVRAQLLKPQLLKNEDTENHSKSLKVRFIITF